MRTLFLPTMLACALAGSGLSGCGGDDGLSRSDGGPKLKAPSRAPGTNVPAVAGDGLLYPDADRRKATKDRAERATGNSKTNKRKRSHKRERRAHLRVAGVRETSGAGTLLDPGPDETPSSQATAPLTKEQQADLDSVADTLRELFRRMNARDAAICTELMTQRHVEEATGTTGGEAVAKCRSDISQSTVSYSLNKISGVRIEGDLAWIQFASSAGNYARWQILRAVRSGGGWRFDGDGSGDI